MKLEALPWLILFLPLAAAGLIVLFTRKDRNLSGGLSIAAVVAGFGLSILFVAVNGWTPAGEPSLNWLTIGPLQADFGLKLDPLSLSMMLIVTGVASGFTFTPGVTCTMTRVSLAFSPA
jgi:NADH-quinone oxidoreductase subunit L